MKYQIKNALTKIITCKEIVENERMKMLESNYIKGNRKT
jgi:hypothetical protein